jgi:hypothetical protein
MIERNKRGIRNVGVKARLAVAAAVLVGGGAAGVVALAANHGGSAAAATATAESAGFTRSFHHTISEPMALTEALNGEGMSWQESMTTLADMTPMRTFSQFQHRHTMFAVQRGIVLLATRKFIVVRSANDAIHLWWLSGATRVRDVGSSASGMAAMTGSYPATNSAMSTGDMIPTENVVAGSTSVVSQLTTPVARPTTITINTGGQVITITVASSTATVTEPTSMMAAQTMESATMPDQTFRTRQSAWWATRGVQRGDLVLIAGTRTHGKLKAELVLFAAPLDSMPTPSVSPTSMFPTQTAVPTAIPTPDTSISGQPVSIGTSS